MRTVFILVLANRKETIAEAVFSQDFHVDVFNSLEHMEHWTLLCVGVSQVLHMCFKKKREIFNNVFLPKMLSKCLLRQYWTSADVIDTRFARLTNQAPQSANAHQYQTKNVMVEIIKATQRQFSSNKTFFKLIQKLFFILQTIHIHKNTHKLSEHKPQRYRRYFHLPGYRYSPIDL